jgi:acyl transferase domain-containing protein
MSRSVAIVGFSFRLPGGVDDTLWEHLRDAEDLVTEVDDSRWSKEAFLHLDKSEPGRSYTFAAGTVGDVRGFDADFFGISPREAVRMDPQHRLLLEMTWEACERGGIRPSRLRGSNTAVFLGYSGTDYPYRWADDLAVIDSTSMTGNTGSVAANRISYWFDLRGPSMAIDTACSSSLVALHQAWQSIQAGEVDQAVVGGIALHLHPFPFVGFSKA